MTRRSARILENILAL